MIYDSEQNKIDLVMDRLKIWGTALNMLAQPEMATQLIRVLEADDLKELEALLEPTYLFQVGGCIDIVETITRILNFGSGHMEERCEVECPFDIRPPSDTEGKIYQLPDGSFMFITERLWAEYCSRAQHDVVWREQNKNFLKALGMLKCYWEWVSDERLITVEKNRTICFPTVIRPIDDIF